MYIDTNILSLNKNLPNKLKVKDEFPKELKNC